MTTVTITREDTISEPSGVCQMTLTITSANNITTNLFVNEQLINPDASTNNVFTTVANLVDIEDYAVGAPASGDKFFLTNTASLVAETVTELNAIFNEVLYLLELVCQQNDDIGSSPVTVTYAVDSSGASISS